MKEREGNMRNNREQKIERERRGSEKRGRK